MIKKRQNGYISIALCIKNGKNCADNPCKSGMQCRKSRDAIPQKSCELTQRIDKTRMKKCYCQWSDKSNLPPDHPEMVELT